MKITARRLGPRSRSTSGRSKHDRIPRCRHDAGEAIRAADGVIFVTPEYNYSIRAAQECARLGFRVQNQPLKDKPVAIQSANARTDGWRGMQYHLRSAMCPQRADVQHPEILWHRQNKFDDSSNSRTRPDQVRQAALAGFRGFIRKVSGKGDYRWLVVRFTYSCLRKPAQGSFNAALARSLTGLAPPSLALRYAAPLDSIPAYNADVQDAGNPPPSCPDEAIRAADASSSSHRNTTGRFRRAQERNRLGFQGEGPAVPRQAVALQSCAAGCSVAHACSIICARRDVDQAQILIRPECS